MGQEANPDLCFSSLPKEIKQIIFSYFTDVREVIRIQATNRDFQKLLWQSITSLDLKHMLGSQFKTDDTAWWSPTGDRMVRALTIVERLDPAIVTELHLSSFYVKGKKTGVHLFSAFANLKKLSYDFSQQIEVTPHDVINLRQLSELTVTRTSLDFEWSPIEELSNVLTKQYFKDIPSHVRINCFAPEALERIEQPNFNALATDYVRLSKEGKTSFPRVKQAVIGLSYTGKVIVGFEDGSLSIYKYEKEDNSLTFVSENNSLHGGRINQITVSDDKVIIASSDGKISVSQVTDDGLSSVAVFTFPEPIYTCLFTNVTNATYIAAGKNTVYISVDDKIVKQRSFDSEVTGMSYSIFGYVIATRKRYYRGPGTLKIDEVDQLEEDANIETPNMSISPDGSLRATVTQTELALYDIERHAPIYSFPGKFSDGAHSQAYNPIDFWITMSTGHSIATLELQSKQLITYFAPEVSEKDLRDGNLPTIRALWYEAAGLALFALLSDNTLRWWKLLYGPKAYCNENQAKTEVAKTEQPTVAEPDDEDAQPIIPPAPADATWE